MSGKKFEMFKVRCKQSMMTTDSNCHRWSQVATKS